LECLAKRPVHACLSTWRPGDQPIYVSDTSRAQRDFGWAPEVSVDEGLERLWAWACLLAEGPRSNGHVANLAPSEPAAVQTGVLQADPIT
jgi:hypothetical protein